MSTERFKHPYMKALKLLLPLALITTAHASISLTFDASNISSGDTVDVFDDVTQISTSYTGAWSDSATGASGTWTLEVTDQTSSDTVSFIQVPTVQDLPTIPFGQGIQFVIDGTTANQNGDDNAIDFTFSYTFDTVGSASTSDFGAAFAAGPNGAGQFDNGGGTLPTDGFVFDIPDSGVTPNYDPLTGAFSTTPNSGVASDSANQDYTIFFEGTNTITYNGNVNDIDTFVFGIGAASITPIPEPSSTALLGLGALALITRRRR